MMLRIILVSICMSYYQVQAQHPYFDIPISEIDSVSQDDGYRSVATIEGECIVYHLYLPTDTVILVYKSGMTLPLYIIYREQ
tara:strand:- start:869 stop:1114 length:246 start_codon:yes stop_codon:yes gene_type:complete